MFHYKVSVVLRRIVFDNIGSQFNNLSGSRLQVFITSNLLVMEIRPPINHYTHRKSLLSQVVCAKRFSYNFKLSDFDIPDIQLLGDKL